jgi:hypothetical protein
VMAFGAILLATDKTVGLISRPERSTELSKNRGLVVASRLGSNGHTPCAAENPYLYIDAPGEVKGLFKLLIR